jgi:hypothetical protein
VTARIACRLGVAFLLSASLLASQSKPPTSAVVSVNAPDVLALVVDVSGKAVRLVSATPARGRVLAPDIDARVAAVREGGVVWIEYVLKRGASGEVTTRGGFLVSMSAIVESPRGEKSGGLVRVESRLVTVAVPYVPDATTITFAKVEPSSTLPPEKWVRIPMGTALLPGVHR